MRLKKRGDHQSGNCHGTNDGTLVHDQAPRRKRIALWTRHGGRHTVSTSIQPTPAGLVDALRDHLNASGFSGSMSEFLVIGEVGISEGAPDLAEDVVWGTGACPGVGILQ